MTNVSKMCNVIHQNNLIQISIFLNSLTSPFKKQYSSATIKPCNSKQNMKQNQKSMVDNFIKPEKVKINDNNLQ